MRLDELRRAIIAMEPGYRRCRGRHRYHRQMQVRLANLGDAEAIRTIYNFEVTGSTSTFDLVPRTPEDQVAWLRRHEGAHPAVVATDPDGTVLGFGSLSTFRDRPCLFDDGRELRLRGPFKAWIGRGTGVARGAHCSGHPAGLSHHDRPRGR